MFAAKLSLNQIKSHKNHFLYLKLILLLSGDIRLNPGPIQNDHLKENWKTFRNMGLHYTFGYKQLAVKNWWIKRNSKNIKPNSYGITETNLDNSIIDSEISINGYCAIWCDRNEKGGGVICCITNKICYNTKNCNSNEIENIFIKLLIIIVINIIITSYNLELFK